MSVTGKIFNISRFAVNDGPGIRTTVFLKGCPLHCLWCHNPESLSRKSQLMFYSDRCTLCGRCAAVCLQECHSFADGAHAVAVNKCISCGKCAEICPTEALKICGTDHTPEEIMKTVLKDKPFYGEEGGITVSGGEPLYQPEFTIALLSLAKENGIHTCMETSGAVSAKSVEEACKVTDLFLVDFKHTSKDMLKQYTGADLSVVKRSLSIINGAGIPVILRCPIIPSVNDCQEHFSGIAEIANTFSVIKEINLMPYHRLGEQKNQAIFNSVKQCYYEAPTKEMLEEWITAVRKETSVPVFGNIY